MENQMSPKVLAIVNISEGAGAGAGGRDEGEEEGKKRKKSTLSRTLVKCNKKYDLMFSQSVITLVTIPDDVLIAAFVFLLSLVI